MPESQYEREEYLEQDEAEAETAGHRKSVVALLVLGLLVIAGVVLVSKLKTVSAVEDCLLAHGSNCNDLVAPPKPMGVR
jgi:hypothetical protein